MSTAAIRYAHPGEHLVDHLVRLAFALDRAEAVQAAVDDNALAALDDLLEHHAAQLAARTAASLAAGLVLPVELVAHRFGLDRGSLALLIAAALPGLDVALAARWQRLARSTEPERRVYELVDLVAPHDPAAALFALGAPRTLQRGRLIRLASSRDWVREAPLLQRVISVPDCVIDALRGDFVLDRQLALVASYQPPVTGVEPMALGDLGATLAARGPGAVVVLGPARVGKVAAIATAAARLGRDALVAGLDVIAAAGDAHRCLEELECQARLLDDVLVLRGSLESLPLPLRRAVIELVERGVAILATRDAGALRHLRAPQAIAIATPDASAQAGAWRSQLGDSDADVAAVVARCSLPIGEIVEAAAGARATTRTTTRAPTTADAIAAARARLQHRLGDVASIVTTTLAWSDLVVREEVSQRIFEVLAAVQFKQHVLDTWGFGDKLPYGRSISALLSGPPGTGKTMVATLIAKELGLELFRVDLSKVVSKWIGETEKNLGTVFDEAARVGAVLLFDEADALFGKRTDVKSSNDRNANLEVNYLLQRLEQHDGIVLLTTNHVTHMDEAFMRRLRFRIEFPRPEVAEREALWRSMIPERAPLDGDVDLGAIARRYDMAGGFIKNAVVRAAFLAAERGAPAIDHATLLQAATLEWTELGNLPT